MNLKKTSLAELDASKLVVELNNNKNESEK